MSRSSYLRIVCDNCDQEIDHQNSRYMNIDTMHFIDPKADCAAWAQRTLPKVDLCIDCVIHIQVGQMNLKDFFNKKW